MSWMRCDLLESCVETVSNYCPLSKNLTFPVLYSRSPNFCSVSARFVLEVKED